MPKVTFTYSQVGCDRKHYLTEEDVRVVLSRLPAEAWNGLRKVHFNDKSRDARRLGYANPRSHEIAICALPPRVSMTAAMLRGQSPELFGAVRGRQWPELAVRRFLLYDVLLHESTNGSGYRNDDDLVEVVDNLIASEDQYRPAFVRKGECVQRISPRFTLAPPNRLRPKQVIPRHLRTQHSWVKETYKRLDQWRRLNEPGVSRLGQ